MTKTKRTAAEWISITKLKQVITEMVNKVRSQAMAHFKVRAKEEKPLSIQAMRQEFHSLADGFRSIKKEFLLITTPESQNAMGVLKKAQYDKRVKENTQAVIDLGNDIAIKEGLLIPPEKPVSKLKRYLAAGPLVILLVEAFMEVGSFQIFAVPWLVGLGIACGFAYIKWSIVSIADKKFRSDWNLKAKVILGLTTLVAMSIASYFLGVFRNLYLTSKGLDIPNGPEAFALIGMVFFAGAFAAEHLLANLRKRIDIQKRYDAGLVEIEAMYSKREHMKSAGVVLEKERDEALAEHAQIMEQSDIMLKGLQHDYCSVVGRALGQYLKYRSGRSGQVPDYSTIELPTIIDDDDFSRFTNPNKAKTQNEKNNSSDPVGSASV